VKTTTLTPLEGVTDDDNDGIVRRGVELSKCRMIKFDALFVICSTSIQWLLPTGGCLVCRCIYRRLSSLDSHVL